MPTARESREEQTAARGNLFASMSVKKICSWSRRQDATHRQSGELRLESTDFCHAVLPDGCYRADRSQKKGPAWKADPFYES